MNRNPPLRGPFRKEKKCRRAGNESLEIRVGFMHMQDVGDRPQLVSALAQHLTLPRSSRCLTPITSASCSSPSRPKELSLGTSLCSRRWSRTFR
jgi:hypothetical protein